MDNMASKSSIMQLDMLRDFSSAFSRSAITDIIKFEDYSYLKWLYYEYGDNKGVKTYGEYLKSLYSALLNNYRCEYVYKNELIGHIVRHHKKTNTVAFNEFKVGDSIVDIALFNGESKAFEIKTEFDSPRRLEKQMRDYRKVFDKCYVVVPSEKVEDYARCIDNEVGLLSLSKNKGNVSFQEFRDAKPNETIDSDVLITCLRTKEYEQIIRDYFGYLPEVPDYDMYGECKKMMKTIPDENLKTAFLELMKNRKKDMAVLRKAPKELRQVYLSLNLLPKDIDVLADRLEMTLN